ncbi:N-6 DNA methylase [Pseudomonas farris]
MQLNVEKNKLRISEPPLDGQTLKKTARKSLELQMLHTNLKQVNNNIITELEHIELEESYALSKLTQAQRKTDGVFFTPNELAEIASKKFNYIKGNGTVLDPACGTGNLLLKVAEKLSSKPTIQETLKDWNEKLYGLDINESFIEIAKKKIIKLAVARSTATTTATLPELTSILTNIRSGDFLVEHESYIGIIDNIFMNPPFCPINTPNHISWTSGKSNAAATFMDISTKVLPQNGKLVAILPDVLKSGSRYERWRAAISEELDYNTDDFGSFEKDVQIDVFFLNGVKTKSNHIKEKHESAESHTTTLSGSFEVCVGPVVPHRDKATGINAPFAHAKILPAWATISQLSERITHSGKKIAPPFIAIRRTSSPRDKHRIVGSIVNCQEAVAVENHIIVLRPFDGKLSTCKKMLSHLKSKEINDYINSNIRCRHLTVQVVKLLPMHGISDE